MKPARDEKEVELVRERILEGALDIIVQDGYEALTMRELASRIGMTAPNIYNYFSNKDAIYVSLVVRGMEMLQQDLLGAYESSDDKMERVHAMIKAYTNFGISQPRYYEIMFVRPNPKSDMLMETPFEDLSVTEYRIGLDIARLTIKAAKDMMGQNISFEEAQRRVVHIWCLLHGMISLRNSHIINFVYDRKEIIYQNLIDELLASLKGATA